MILQITPSQKKDNLQSCRFFTPTLQHQKIFMSPCPSPFKSNRSYKTQRNWSTSAEKQRRHSQKLDWSNCKTGRNIQYDEEEAGNQKTFQILLRQSLRRAQNIRTKNNKLRNVSFPSTDNHTNSARKIQHLNNESGGATPFDNLSELEGKRCLIGTPNQRKTSAIQSKFRKSKSQPKNCQKQTKQLSIIFDSQQQQTYLKNEPVVALGMASKKLGHATQSRIVPQVITCNNVNKIAVSTTSCFILADPNKGSYGLNLDNQNNFIRAKKKSKNLVKRANILQKELQEHQQNYGQAKIMNFKNAFAINGQLRASITKDGASGVTQRKNTYNKVKKQESLKISGWEVNGWDHQPGF